MKIPSVVLSRADVRKLELAAYVDGGAVIRSSRETPSAAGGAFKIGTWMVDDDHDVFVLRRVRLDALTPTEFAWANFREPFHFPRIRDAERYAGWMEDGHEPPPITVLETDKGALNVNDGHRRLAAHALLARKTIKAWVSPTGGYGAGLSWEDATGRPWSDFERLRTRLGRP